VQIKNIQSILLPGWIPSREKVESFWAAHLPLYRFLSPVYKLKLLEAIARLFPPRADSMLDLGAGDGLLGSAIQRFFPVEYVCGVDVVNRMHPLSTIDFSAYNGISLPFEDASFDVVLLCNVIHHVRPVDRRRLLDEISRVCRGSVIIKDHLERGMLSRASLSLADWVGNAPFGGMVRASYLEAADWELLADNSRFKLEAYGGLRVQTGIRRVVFPDKNEIMLRFIKTSNYED
jgi:SAM-dependent methyltransferase